MKSDVSVPAQEQDFRLAEGEIKVAHLRSIRIHSEH